MSRKIESIVQGIAQPILETLGLTLVDVAFTKQGASCELAVFIDKDGGVSLDDCEQASRLIEAELDRIDPIESSYCLVVSSPGLDRPLKKPADFERNMGKKVDVRLYGPSGGSREWTGVLRAYDGERIVLDTGEEKAFPLKDIALIRLHTDF